MPNIYRIPEEVMFYSVLSFLKIDEIANFAISYKSFLKYCHKTSLETHWETLIYRNRMFPVLREYPEGYNKPFTMFLRLSNPTRCFGCLCEGAFETHPFFKIKICNFCIRKDAFRCINYQNARSFLNDSALNTLPSFTYISDSSMRIFLFSDVCNTYNNIRKFPMNYVKKSMRLQEITDALKILRLEPRTDSELCRDYIEGVSYQPIETIVETMAFMRYLHEYTDYKSKLEECVMYLRNTYGCFYTGIWRDASEFCQKQYDIPDKWPWL